MDKISNTFGGKSKNSKGIGTDQKGSVAETVSGCIGTKEEVEAYNLLLKEASLTSLSRYDNG